MNPSADCNIFSNSGGFNSFKSLISVLFSMLMNVIFPAAQRVLVYFSLGFFVKRSPHLPLSFSLWTLYPIASCLQLILCHGIIALNVLSLMHLVMLHPDISAERHLSNGN
ncbi:hypothetical protein TNCT_208261 [Trichonephila clavata]|uniref:Uncharacterized protein n=1 Tax=Trichonephila clavata TaxID=2740835 RepID=A0A8X6M1P1_TRICU|nr:hypothetical protein TNCT_208261 [Trichonephila clavata]